MKLTTFALFEKLVAKTSLFLSICSLAACAHTGTRVGVASPVATLGTPAMMQTSLGRLAVWDVGANVWGAPNCALAFNFF
jgi:hypothetical protein